MSPPASDRAQTLRSRLAALRRELESLEGEVGALASGGLGPGGGGTSERLDSVREGLQQILRASSAPTTLNLLLTHAVRHGRRAVLFVLRRGELWAWSGLGPGGERLQMAQLSLRPEESPSLASAMQSLKTRRCDAPEAWTERLGGPSPGVTAAIPLVSAERCSGVLWLDFEPQGGEVEAVECLAVAAGAALELIAHKRSGALTPVGRVTADERALGGGLPYAIGEEAGASEAGPGAAPGLGGASPPGPDLARQHDDARRLARLLVSEIKLYNEDKVVLGRKTRDIYQKLREDIERSRKVYMERVSPEVRVSTDYFQQELVACLADGDESLLGPVPASTS